MNTATVVALAAACTIGFGAPTAAWAQTQTQRPAIESMRTPPGATLEQVRLGDRIFHGEAAAGQCAVCHGWDAKGTPNGNDLTLGMWIWGDGSLKTIKATILHNMSIAPGMDGDLQASDVDAVAAYVWALGHPKR